MSILDLLNKERDTITVSELTSNIRDLLEGCFPDIWIEGEISNFKRHTSGHWYFVLKDEQAQIRCASFRNQNAYIRFQPEDGAKVVAKGSLSVYEPRGEYQLIVSSIRPLGRGELQQALEELKVRLAAEGLFSEERKRPIRRIPNRIAIITSPKGAVLHDILKVLARRNPAVSILVCPVRVQGSEAAREIVEAFRVLNRRTDIDTIILARGGGSSEDLSSFNEESVVRAIADSKIPVISAIGHETDFTLADFVADRRAPTPSAAAEIVAIDISELRAEIAGYLSALDSQIRYILLESRHHLERLRASHSFELAPRIVRRYSQQLDHLTYQLDKTISSYLDNAKELLAHTAGKLDALSPLAVLARGYAIARTSEGRILHSTSDTEIGQQIEVKLYRGQLKCTVDEID